MSIQETTTPSLRLLTHSTGSDPDLHHITALPRRPLEGAHEIRAMYRELCAELTARGLHVLQEKLYGEASASPMVAAARGEALAARGARADHLPMTLVGSRPCHGGQVAGVQICAASGPSAEDGACRTLRLDGQAVGRQLQTPGARLAFFADITGMDPTEHQAAPRTVQCQRMFQRVTRLVQEFGFTFQDVARTWIYVLELLRWYDELNRVRTEAYTELGVYDPKNFAALPASTGIQAAHPTGAECFMDLLLVSGTDPAAPPTRPMSSTQQCEAASYGSSFSRGKQVLLEGARLLYVSGTASINLAGETVHPGDHGQQILVTLAAVQNLLAAEGADLADIVTSALFFKDEQGFRSWQDLQLGRRVPALPGVAVYGDVCRDDLLFELEPLAVVAG